MFQVRQYDNTGALVHNAGTYNKFAEAVSIASQLVAYCAQCGNDPAVVVNVEDEDQMVVVTMRVNKTVDFYA